MLGYDLDKMLFSIPSEKHSAGDITEILKEHPEVQFVSLVGIDIGGHDTDEKIPVQLFLEDIEKVLANGVQTDGSSVALPRIAELNNAKVDIIPDLSVNWYVDYNFNNTGFYTGLPVGTLRTPLSWYITTASGAAREFWWEHALQYFKEELIQQLKEHPYVFSHIAGIDSAEEIEDLIITSATELEFWVKTPDDKGDRGTTLYRSGSEGAVLEENLRRSPHGAGGDVGASR